MATPHLQLRKLSFQYYSNGHLERSQWFNGTDGDCTRPLGVNLKKITKQSSAHYIIEIVGLMVAF